MDPHLQEQASLCLVVEGSYREKIHALEHEHGPRHLLYYPAYAVHSQTFGYKGAKKIIFTRRERWAEAHGMEIPWASRPESLTHFQQPTLSARFWKAPE
jgi:hypothetical protein